MGITIRKIIFLILFLQFAFITSAQKSTTESFSRCNLEKTPMPSADVQSYIQAMQNQSRKIGSDSIMLPIVIHNLTWNHKGYVSDEKLIDWIKNTNNALANRRNFYDPEGLDTRFRLCLTNIDPEGNPSTGIIHKEDIFCLHREIYLDNPQLYDSWPNNKYINIFVMEGLSGVARFPWNVSFDGLAVSSKLIENDYGVEVLCHELGHYFGLYHTFEGGCRNDGCLIRGDMVCDTRPDQVSFTRCDDLNSCPTDVYEVDPDNPFTEDDFDMDENYMDGGTCRSRFTQGQVERMHWALDTYRMPDTSILNSTNLCGTCQPIILSIEPKASQGLVGEPLPITAISSMTDVVYSWFVDEIWQSNLQTFDLTAQSSGVKRIRLEVSPIQDSLCIAPWTMEKSISFLCDTLPKFLDIPDEIIVDSCYEFSANGFNNLAWSFSSQSGVDNWINICPTEKGQTSLVLNYGAGACRQMDSVTIHVRGISDKYSRKYYRQEFLDSVIERSINRIVKIEKLPNNIIALFGEKYTSGLSVQFWSVDSSANFISYWDPETQFVENWELYHLDTFRRKLESDFPIETNMQIHPKDWHFDNNGNIYFLASEQYPYFSDVKGLIVGKLNILGQVEWCKRIYTPDFWVDQGVSNVPSYLELSNNEITVAFHQVILKLNVKGELIQSKNIKIEPVTKNHDGIYSSIVDFEINGDEIKAYGVHFQLDAESYVSVPNQDLLSTNFNTKIYCAEINLNKEAHILYSFDFKRVALRPTMIAKHPKGHILYWFAYHDDGEGESNIIRAELYQHHLAMFDDNGNFLWWKSYKDADQRSDRGSRGTNIHVLDNGDIIIANGGDVLFDQNDKAFHGGSDYLRFDQEGIVLEDRKYQADGKRSFLSSSFSVNQPSILTEDGLLVATHQQDSLFGRVLLNLYPLDNDNLDCSTGDSIFYEIESLPLELDTSPLEMVLLDTKVRLEDIELHIKKSYSRTVTLCDSTHIIDDYSFGNIVTSCISNTEMRFNFEVCRELSHNSDTVILNLSTESPLTNEIHSSKTVDVIFGDNEMCSQVSFILPRQDYHVMLNSKTDYSSPFTVKKSFFDAAEKLEYDYSNNYLFVEACDYSVSTSSLVKKKRLSIFPNPANQNIELYSEGAIIQAYGIYSILGEQLLYSQSGTKRPNIDISNLKSGAYIIVVEFIEGYQQIGKLIKN